MDSESSFRVRPIDRWPVVWLWCCPKLMRSQWFVVALGLGQAHFPLWASGPPSVRQNFQRAECLNVDSASYRMSK